MCALYDRKERNEEDLLEPEEWNSERDGLWVSASNARAQKKNAKVFKENNQGRTALDLVLDNVLSQSVERAVNKRSRSVKKD